MTFLRTLTLGSLLLTAASAGCGSSDSNAAPGPTTAGAAGAAGHAENGGSAGSTVAGAPQAAGSAGVAGTTNAAGAAGNPNAGGNTNAAGAANTAGAGGDPGAGGSIDTAGSGGTAAGGAGGSIGTSEMVDVGEDGCFTLATGTATTDNPCGGDLYFEAGENVDLSGAGASGSPFCVAEGSNPDPAASLADVPTDYSACAWSGYIEGGNGLANTGFIVRDASTTHHYRMHITSNTLPTLVFEYVKID